MKNLIIYSTKYGFVKKCVRNLKLKLNNETETFNISLNKIPDLDDYNCIVFGGSIYAGKIQKKLTKFIKKNLDKLLTKNIALFICSGGEQKDSLKYLKNVFPEALQKKAASKELFGGEFKLVSPKIVTSW